MSYACIFVTITFMEKRIDYEIKENDCGKTIESYLRERGYSRKILVHLRQTNLGITVAGELAYTTRVLKEGNILSVRLSEETSSERIIPVPMELSVLYEDEDLMVINKAAGMPVHPSQGNFDNTLANGLAWYFKEKGEAFVFRAVNRLDRDTTGLLLIAKNMLSGAILSSMVSEKTIRREYRAIVSGLTEEEGCICRPIARAEGSTIERCVDPERGEYACTRYRRLGYDRDKDCSLLLITLDTGRTHQIRVHFSHIGHPLAGDDMYGGHLNGIGRQALCCSKVLFVHPVTGHRIELTCPPQDDMMALVQ